MAAIAKMFDLLFAEKGGRGRAEVGRSGSNRLGIWILATTQLGKTQFGHFSDTFISVLINTVTKQWLVQLCFYLCVLVLSTSAHFLVCAFAAYVAWNRLYNIAVYLLAALQQWLFWWEPRDPSRRPPRLLLPLVCLWVHNKQVADKGTGDPPVGRVDSHVSPSHRHGHLSLPGLRELCAPGVRLRFLILRVLTLMVRGKYHSAY